MMQLTPKKIAAIKAIADDERGDPMTRAVAKRKLEQMSERTTGSGVLRSSHAPR